MFNLTNIGLNMCVKRIFGFISEFDDWTRANPGNYVRSRELSRMAGKVCGSTRMAGEGCDDSCALKKYPAHGEKFGIALMLS